MKFRVGLATAAALLSVASAIGASAQVPSEPTYIDCSGKLNNGGSSSSLPCVGTDGNDRIIGSSAENDIITGRYGADLIYGNDGGDTLWGDWPTKNGGSGDKLYGNAGNDTFIGQGGTDYMYGSQGSDTFFAKDGVKDYIYCADSNNQAYLDAVAGDGFDDVTNRDSFDVLVYCGYAWK